MKNQWISFMLGAVVLQSLVSIEPAFAGRYHEARREQAKANRGYHEAAVDRREGHHIQAMLHEHQAHHEARRAWRHGY